MSVGVYDGDGRYGAGVLGSAGLQQYNAAQLFPTLGTIFVDAASPMQSEPRFVERYEDQLAASDAAVVREQKLAGRSRTRIVVYVMAAAELLLLGWAYVSYNFQ